MGCKEDEVRGIYDVAREHTKGAHTPASQRMDIPCERVAEAGEALSAGSLR